MSPPPDRKGGARVAVVGAASPNGAHVRAALAAHGVPGDRLDLFGATGGEAVLSEYDGEARLIQEADPAAVASYDVIFLCEPGELARRFVALARPESLILDLEAHPDGLPAAAAGHRGILGVPHSLAVVLAELLDPIEKLLGIDRATAVILRPASDFGEEGLEELRDQTVGLLRFTTPPVDVFGRQLAFNLIPQRLLGDGGPGLERRLEEEVRRLMGWPERRLALRLVMVPVFYGHALSLRVTPATRATVAEVTDALGGAENGIEHGETSTPIEAVGARKTIVSEVSEDGVGGFWIWAVAGEAGAAAAQQAVRLAGAVGGL